MFYFTSEFSAVKNDVLFMCWCSVDFKPAGMALRSVLLAAKREGRLTCGVYLCGKTLEMYVSLYNCVVSNCLCVFLRGQERVWIT